MSVLAKKQKKILVRNFNALEENQNTNSQIGHLFRYKEEINMAYFKKLLNRLKLPQYIEVTSDDLKEALITDKKSVEDKIEKYMYRNISAYEMFEHEFYVSYDLSKSYFNADIDTLKMYKKFYTSMLDESYKEREKINDKISRLSK